MQKLIERLQYHIQRLNEEQWDYTRTTNGKVEYVKDPVINNSFRNFVRDDCERIARGALIDGDWYFWPAKHSTHDDFIKALGLLNRWNPYHKVEIYCDSTGLSIDRRFIGDIVDRVYRDLKDSGEISNNVKTEIRNAVMMILDLKRRYDIKIDHDLVFKLKEMLKGQYPSSRKYDSLYRTNDYWDQAKKYRKINKHNDKSLPRKNRLSRIGWKYSSIKGEPDLELEF